MSLWHNSERLMQIRYFKSFIIAHSNPSKKTNKYQKCEGRIPDFWKGGGSCGTMDAILSNKEGERFTDFTHSDMKISLYISFLLNVSLIMQDLAKLRLIKYKNQCKKVGGEQIQFFPRGNNAKNVS